MRFPLANSPATPTPTPTPPMLEAGVSILLTMMLLKRRKSLGLGSSEVLCYAFAPPPVFGPLHNLSGETRRAIRSFVFGNDMVCRLSLASAYGLFSDLNEVDGIGVSEGVWHGPGFSRAYNQGDSSYVFYGGTPLVFF